MVDPSSTKKQRPGNERTVDDSAERAKITENLVAYLHTYEREIQEQITSFTSSKRLAHEANTLMVPDGFARVAWGSTYRGLHLVTPFLPIEGIELPRVFYAFLTDHPRTELNKEKESL